MSQTELSRLDRAFAAFLVNKTSLDEQQRHRFETLIGFLSSQQNQGHSCIVLAAESVQLVQGSGLASVDGSMPLVLEQNRLYLQRYWCYETRLAQRLARMAEQQRSLKADSAMLQRYFANPDDDVTDWQCEAAKTAISRTFSIITGGPGTGKTTTVVKILALLQELADPPLHIALAAPTGKAAQRLQESIQAQKQQLPCHDSIPALIPETVSTLHRLLGARPASPYFYHDAQTPLPFDVLVIDEASMVDLALMSKLVDALKADARLILLGDKDQLASVEAGAVLADLTSALPDNTVTLKKTHRFNARIKNLAKAVNDQQADIAWSLLQQKHSDVGLLEENLIDYISTKQEHYLELIEKGAEFSQIFKAFQVFQVLCANRHGKNGVNAINHAVERQLTNSGRIQHSTSWYPGRPVMINQNDANIQLYNGDIGLCLPDPEQKNKLMVFFQCPDGGIKKFLPTRLPHCETVFAMTVHKSQGSEFDEVLIILPETINPVLTKELLYTGITRARQNVRLWTGQSVFKRTLSQRVNRLGGLAQKLSANRT